MCDTEDDYLAATYGSEFVSFSIGPDAAIEKSPNGRGIQMVCSMREDALASGT